MDIGSNVTSSGPYIETVRSLHQTVTALRTALEESKKEILHLKTKVWPINPIEQSLTALAIENHALRRKLLENNIDDELPSEKLKEVIKNNADANIGSSQESVDDINRNKEVTDFDQLGEYFGVSTANDIEKRSESNHFDVNEEIKENKSVTPAKSAEKTEERLYSTKVDLKNELQTDSQKPSLTDFVSKEVQPKLIKFEISPCKEIDVKEVNSTGESQLNKLSSSVSDSKKAKKEKQRSKKHSKLPTVLSLKSAHKHKIRASVHIKAKTFDEKRNSKSLDSLTVFKTPSRELKFSKKTNFFNISSKISCEINKSMSGNDKFNMNNEFETKQEVNSDDKVEDDCQNDMEQEPEVDDIELIFTTDDTKESDFKEQLVSIDAIDRQNNAGSVKLLAPDQERSIDISDRELDDDVFDGSFDQDNQDCNALQVFQLERDNSQLYNSKSDNSINQEEKSLRSYYSYQDSSFENKSMEKDESFDRFEERIRIVETDISKVGIQEVEYTGIRRNTCPNPLQYRPLLHRSVNNLFDIIQNHVFHVKIQDTDWFQFSFHAHLRAIEPLEADCMTRLKIRLSKPVSHLYVYKGIKSIFEKL